MENPQTPLHCPHRDHILSGIRGPAKVVAVCEWNDPDHLQKLRQSCGPIPLYEYHGVPLHTFPIVATYNRALQEIDADFFLFVHQDAWGDFPTMLHNALQVMDQHDLVGAIGQTTKGQTFWRNTPTPTPVSMVDECAFGFYKDSGLSFDPALKWTNYSQDLCFRIHSLHATVWVVPNAIGHAYHQHGPWFVESGHYHKERAYVHKKWLS